MSQSDLPVSLTEAAVAARAPSRSIRRSHLPFRRSTACFALITLAMIVAADWLFYRHQVGCTPAIFFAMLAAAMIATSGRSLARWPGRILLLAVIAMSVALLIEPWWLPAILGGVALMSFALVDRCGWTSSVPAWLVRWGEFLLRCFAQPIVDRMTGLKWQRHHARGASPVVAFLARWIVPVLLSLVFVALFSAANPVISGWISDAFRSIGRFLGNFSEILSVGRWLLWIVVGFAVWGLLRIRTRRDRGIVDVDVPAHSALQLVLSPALIVRCLVLFNLVFAVQSAMDLYYLMDPSALPEGMSYREYARRGSYPLVATALLAAVFVLTTFRSGGATQQLRIARLLVYAWIAQNLLLIFSAAWRLWLYVEVYSVTRLRVATAVWMILVAVGLVSIIWRIVSRRTNAWLLRVNTVSAAVVLFACCFINFDNLIAWHNVKHCRELGWARQEEAMDRARLDLPYLRRMGPDALPATSWLISQLGDDDPLASTLRQQQGRFAAELDEDMQDWRGWTLRRQHLADSSR